MTPAEIVITALDQYEQRIVDMWRQGASLLQIAVVCGVTRSTIAGKIYRLRGKHDLAPREKAPPAEKTKPQRVRLARRRMVRPRALVEVHAAAPSVAPGFGDLLDELASGQCRWPVNDEAPFRFCHMSAVAPSPYCAHHQEISRRPLRLPYVAKQETFR